MLEDNYAHLRDTIQAPEDVANRLFSRGTIDSLTRDKVQLNTLTVSKKCEELLKAIEHGITADPGVFYKLVEVLHEEPTTEKLGNQLLCDVKSKLASYIDILHSLHVYCIRCAVCTTCSTGQMLSAQSAAGWSKPWRKFGKQGKYLVSTFGT